MACFLFSFFLSVFFFCLFNRRHSSVVMSFSFGGADALAASPSPAVAVAAAAKPAMAARARNAAGLALDSASASASASAAAGASAAAAVSFTSLAQSFSQLLDVLNNPTEHNLTPKEMVTLTMRQRHSARRRQPAVVWIRQLPPLSATVCSLDACCHCCRA